MVVSGFDVVPPVEGLGVVFEPEELPPDGLEVVLEPDEPPEEPPLGLEDVPELDGVFPDGFVAEEVEPLGAVVTADEVGSSAGIVESASSAAISAVVAGTAAGRLSARLCFTANTIPVTKSANKIITITTITAIVFFDFQLMLLLRIFSKSVLNLFMVFSPFTLVCFSITPILKKLTVWVKIMRRIDILS